MQYEEGIRFDRLEQALLHIITELDRIEVKLGMKEILSEETQEQEPKIIKRM